MDVVLAKGSGRRNAVHPGTVVAGLGAVVVGIATLGVGGAAVAAVLGGGLLLAALRYYPDLYQRFARHHLHGALLRAPAMYEGRGSVLFVYRDHLEFVRRGKVQVALWTDDISSAELTPTPIIRATRMTLLGGHGRKEVAVTAPPAAVEAALRQV